MRPRLMIGTLLVLVAAAVTPALAEPVQLLTPHDGTKTDETRPEDTGPSSLLPDRPVVPDTPPADRGSGKTSSTTTYDPTELDQQPKMQTRHFTAQAALECKLSDHPGSLVVVNRSLEELPPGTRIKWQFPDARMRGFFALVGPLTAGATLVADGVIGPGEAASGSCVARVI